MRITKCDICKKTIEKDSGAFSLACDRKKAFDSFEICSACGKPLMKFIKDKKLIRAEKLEKKFI